MFNLGLNYQCLFSKEKLNKYKPKHQNEAIIFQFWSHFYPFLSIQKFNHLFLMNHRLLNKVRNIKKSPEKRLSSLMYQPILRYQSILKKKLYFCVFSDEKPKTQFYGKPTERTTIKKILLDFNVTGKNSPREFQLCITLYIVSYGKLRK